MKIGIGNKSPDIYQMGSIVFSVQQLMGPLQVSVSCPAWHQHIFNYQTDSLGDIMIQANSSLHFIGSLVYQCMECNEKYYTTSNQEQTISHVGGLINIQESPNPYKGCIPCPYGAVCSGNNVVPRPNFWGYLVWRPDSIFSIIKGGNLCVTGP